MMMIIAVRANPDLANLPEQAQQALNKVGFQYPEPQLLGTKTVANKKLILIESTTLPEELETLTYDGEETLDEEGNPISNNGLSFDIEVLAVENEVVDQSLLLPYFEDVPTFELNEDGELVETGTEPVADLTDKLQIWAGRRWIY